MSTQEDQPGKLLTMKVDGLDGTVGSIVQSVDGILKQALFHLKQVDEGKAP